MNEDLVCVYTTGKDYIAVLIRQILADNEIESFVINKKDSTYQFGDIVITSYSIHYTKLYDT